MLNRRFVVEITAATTVMDDEPTNTAKKSWGDVLGSSVASDKVATASLRRINFLPAMCETN